MEGLVVQFQSTPGLSLTCGVLSSLYRGIMRFQFLVKLPLGIGRQSALIAIILISIIPFSCRIIREKTGQLPDYKTRKLLEMYCWSSIYMTVQWLVKGMKESETELADLMIDAMPMPLLNLFREIGIL